MKKILFLFLSLIPLLGMGQTTLSAGDIVLLAFNGDGEYSTGITQDGFSFMPLVNLEAGTEIFFTEIGWSDLANAFIYSTVINDQMVKYTAPTPIAAGTIIRNDEMNTTGFTAYSSNTTYTTAFFEVFNTGNSTGEEVLVFQGGRSTPTFIFAASQRPVGWETNVPAGGVTTGDGSALPPGLINDVTALSLAHYDNYAYTGPTTPTTTADWKSRIGNPSNWTGDDTTPTILSSGSYSVTDAPPLTSTPTITTSAATSITATSATLGGNVTADGGATVTERGVVYSLSSANTNPQIDGAGVTRVAYLTGGTGEFSQLVSSLSPNTTYYFNAYAINSEGASYGTAANFTTTPEATMPSGSGDSESDPYLISNLAELYWVAEQTNSGNSFSGKYFKQTADIDASATSTWNPDGAGGYYGWSPIGEYVGPNYYDFKGSYNGQRYVISNLYINRYDNHQYNIGLFGYCTNATFANIGLVDASIKGFNSVGILVGVPETCTIQNCYSTGAVICSSNGGGLIGWDYFSPTSNCYSTASVTGIDATLSGDYNNIGGFTGVIDGCNINNCYATGAVTGNLNVWIGGFAGESTSDAVTNNCYSTGLVTPNGSSAYGGFLGMKTSGTLTGCFWDGETSGQADSPGGETIKTTLEMKTPSTFTNAGWNSLDWILNDGSYPLLFWQGTFTGTVNNDWTTGGNWFNGNVPTSGTDVIIPAGKTAEIAPGTSANCNNISIDPAGSLTIKSDATNAGSLIVSGTATGNATYQSYLSETGKWHVVTAPVAGQNVWGFATLAGNSIAEKTGKRAVTEYIEATNTWDINYPTADTEGSFAAGSGYSVLRSDVGVVSYTGAINTSDVSKPITRGLYGWNALGNPYTSAINATVTAHATNNLISVNTDNLDPVFAALYVWDAATSQYVTINNTGTGTLVQNYIQAGQGFFVRAKDNSGLNFSITEAMQTHQTATPLKSAENTWPTILLTAKSNNKLSSTMVTFNSQMTNGLDVTYDAGMFKADKNFALYSKLVDDNGNDFAIQALPEKFEGLIIPLGIDALAGTEISFSAGTFNLPAEATVYIEDRASNRFTKLDATEAVYTVTITDQTKGAGNFYLHTSAATTGIENHENRIQVYTRNRAIFVNGNLGTNDIVAVYGVDGKLHYKNTPGKNGLLRIDTSGLPAGIYLVSISQKAGRVTHKIILGE